jgi:hypothetical protein
MWICKDKNGNKAEIRYHFNPDRVEQFMVVMISFKGSARAGPSVSLETAKAEVEQILGKVEWKEVAE